MLFALLNRNKILGIFDDKKKCKLIFNGLISNKLVREDQMEIACYINNSLCRVTDSNFFISSDSNENDEVESTTTDNTTKSDEKDNSDNERKNNKKIKLQNKILKLKKKKEKYKEYQNRFNVDLDLYKKFKNMKTDNDNFDIPEMFLGKFDFMTDLEKDNKLNLDNFIVYYRNEKITTSHEGMFYTGNNNIDNFSNSSEEESDSNDNSDNSDNSETNGNN
jgi:hypothetical protein